VVIEHLFGLGINEPRIEFGGTAPAVSLLETRRGDRPVPLRRAASRNLLERRPAPKLVVLYHILPDFSIKMWLFY
jgi:hypothetical protein